MKAKTFSVVITKHESKGAYFVASYGSQFLGATFSVEFPNSLFGSIAFHHFMDMLKTRYQGVHFTFRIYSRAIPNYLPIRSLGIKTHAPHLGRNFVTKAFGSRFLYQNE